MRRSTPRLCSRAHKGSRSAGAILSICLLLATGCSAGATSVEVIVDMSASFAPLTKEDGDALQSIGSAIVKIAVEQWEQPVRLFWATIGSSSIGRQPPCGKAKQYR